MKTRIVLAVFVATLFAVTLALSASKAWTIWDCYTREPLIGHDNHRVTFTCKFCQWTKVFFWKDFFWNDAAEPVLIKHIEAFHVQDIRRAGQEQHDKL